MRHKRFLVVDDEQSVADFVRTVIELEGGIAVIATTAALALACLREDAPFDLMVLDLALPDLSGWDLLRLADGLLNGCKVMIFSAQLPEDSAERARRAGVALSLVKPLAAPALRDALQSALESPLAP